MKNLIIGLMILTGIQVWAHGEDKPGPHGGFISMPGAFHVELVPISDRELKVYLLDMHWKNPTIKNSTVEISMESTSATCAAKKDHFVCQFSTVLRKAGELKVNATREMQIGNTVKYALPLKFKKEH